MKSIVGPHPQIAKATADAEGDYLLALKGNQPTLHAEVGACFAHARASEIETVQTIDKDHGRIETRTASLSRNVRWLLPEDHRRDPGHRAHWGIESFHRVLDVVFREDLSRLRRGRGAQNMALVRRFAFNIVRHGRGKRSIKTARKAAGWSPDFLASLLIPSLC